LGTLALNNFFERSHQAPTRGVDIQTDCQFSIKSICINEMPQYT